MEAQKDEMIFSRERPEYDELRTELRRLGVGGGASLVRRVPGSARTHLCQGGRPESEQLPKEAKVSSFGTARGLLGRRKN